MSNVAAAARAVSATAQAPAASAQADAARAEHAWQTVRGMGDIQFTPVPPPPPEVPYVPPHWLQVAIDALAKVLLWINEHVFMPLGLVLAKSGQVILVLILIVGAVALAWLAWGVLAPWRQARGTRAGTVTPEWAPAPQAALALLEDADALAAQGRFAEAVHLLLQRSVADIAAARPDWLAPSSTAREIAAIDALPSAAAHAFATMADEVERARYALRMPGEGEWLRARGAYAAFALQPLGAAA
ncbi:hypothetical protein [Novosphingobium sp. SG720]|uniref:hypothetical protein n=1 Tax=Novosphingobium sp. SG720 TaxID=2586998 RepID=UPI0017CF9F43|nr:hypothetical protein [Novosphingobium sp. SG720]